jgi:hypothetical protein
MVSVLHCEVLHGCSASAGKGCGITPAPEKGAHGPLTSDVISQVMEIGYESRDDVRGNEGQRTSLIKQV